MIESSVSVIIPMFNAERTIKLCLDSIKGNTYKNYEIILVDNGSTDKTFDYAREYAKRHKNIRLVKASKKGPSHARNIGAKHAKGSILAFLDSDCIVKKDWLQKIIDGFRSHDAVAVAAQYCDSYSKGFIEKFAFYELLFRERNFKTYVENASSCNFAVKKEVFSSLGGFPEEFTAGEDIHFTYEVSKKGKIVWDKSNGVVHFFRASIKSYLNQQYGYAKHCMKLLIKNPTLLTKETIQDKNNYLEMLATGLILLAGIAAFFNVFFLWIVGLAFALILGLNVQFLLFVKKRENAFFALKSISVAYLRNLCWVIGSVSGAVWILANTQKLY